MSKNQPLISLIIPVYGVEAYIEKFAVSAFEQSYSNIEYVFVNDATQDNSIDVLYDVLERFPDRKKQVVLVENQTNLGLVAARRLGLLTCSGDLIAHIDPDDWLERDYCLDLVECLEDNQADIVWCDYFRNEDNIQSYCVIEAPCEQIGHLEGMLNGSCFSSLCCRLVRRTVYGNIDTFQFPHTAMTEDLVYSVQLTINARKIVHLQKALYHYRQNTQSISFAVTNERVQTNFSQLIENTNLILKILSAHGLLKQLEESVKIKKCLCKDYLCLSTMSTKCCNLYKTTYPEVNNFIFHSPQLSLNIKIRALLVFLRLPFVIQIIRKLKK